MGEDFGKGDLRGRKEKENFEGEGFWKREFEREKGKLRKRKEGGFGILAEI